MYKWYTYEDDDNYEDSDYLNSKHVVFKNYICKGCADWSDKRIKCNVRFKLLKKFMDDKIGMLQSKISELEKECEVNRLLIKK